MRKRKPALKDYFFVAIQMVLFVIYAFPVHIMTINLPEWLRHSGLVILGLGVVLGMLAVLQLNAKLSPFPTPVSDGKLITSGAFSVARHPIYTALIMSGLGYALYQASVYKLLLTMLLFALFYYKSKYEEQLLENTFSEYGWYRKKTRRFL